jgi:hypothetical protein
MPPTGWTATCARCFARLSKALLIVLAVLIGLPMVGIDLTTLSVFGGALGVGLGLGLQKIASNYVSGFIILLDNSIRIGNVISVGNDRGEVTRITTRYTVLKNVTGVESLVPNELLVGSVVQNESYSNPRVRMPCRCRWLRQRPRTRHGDHGRRRAAPAARAGRSGAGGPCCQGFRRFRHQPRTRRLGGRSGATARARCAPKSTWRSGASSSRPASKYPFRSGKYAFQGEPAMSETRLIHGFHAVTAKLRHAADDVREITVAEGARTAACASC